MDVHTCELTPASTQGPPVVLLHGLGDSHLTWSRVAGALAQRRRVLLPDLAGHGLSSRPDASYALSWHADVMGAWLDALALDTVDLVGHSYGGGVAQWMLLSHRERIRRLVLVAPGGLGRRASVSLRLASLGLIERVGQPFLGIGTRIGLGIAGAHFTTAEVDDLAWMSSRPGTARALSRTIMDVIDLRGQRRHFLDRAYEIGELPPISLSWGDRDPVLSFVEGRKAAELLEGAPFSHYEQCGHFPHRERSDRFLTELDAFLAAEHVASPRLRTAIRAQVPAALEPPPSAVRRALRAVVRGLGRALGIGRPKAPTPALASLTPDASP